ncbi:hypothetical protein VNO77_19577 [Canavalia gladiata]|uniref:Transmembrane 9 superfamily member n=1 Tax=Canavalia gladiata TaxID=3824 RepID=A0AAN9QPR7_CANGL
MTTRHEKYYSNGMVSVDRSPLLIRRNLLQVHLEVSGSQEFGYGGQLASVIKRDGFQLHGRLLVSSLSTRAIPFSLFVILILLWFCIFVPLILVGGYFGARAPHIKYPVRTNQIPREIPQQRYPSWLLVLGADTLPFRTLFLELFFIMSSIWMGCVYYVFRFLFIVLILLVVVCAEVSLVLTYMHLCVRWTGDGGGNHSLPPVLLPYTSFCTP